MTAEPRRTPDDERRRMPAPIRSPFTVEQQRELNVAQQDPTKLEFTCPNDGDVLVAGPHWTCPSCEYTQYWAHADMALTVTDMKRRAADAQTPQASPLDAAEGWLHRCARGEWPTAGATVKHLPVLRAEYDRRGQVVERARLVEDGTVTNGGPWRQNAEIAEWILRGGES